MAQHTITIFVAQGVGLSGSTTSFLEAKSLKESDWFKKSYRTQSLNSYPIMQNHKSQHVDHAYNKVYAIIIAEMYARKREACQL